MLKKRAKSTVLPPKYLVEKTPSMMRTKMKSNQKRNRFLNISIDPLLSLRDVLCDVVRYWYFPQALLKFLFLIFPSSMAKHSYLSCSTNSISLMGENVPFG